MFGILLGIMWFFIGGLILILFTINLFTEPKVLKKKDYYGSYVINKKYFKGKQADWQYDHFRFTIKKNDSIDFYLTDKEKIIKTYHGIVKTTNPDKYASARLILEMDQPTHHILASNPTTYRDVWSFNLVFQSLKFNNMYFTKGDWEPSKNEY